MLIDARHVSEKNRARQTQFVRATATKFSSHRRARASASAKPLSIGARRATSRKDFFGDDFWPVDCAK